MINNTIEKNIIDKYYFGYNGIVDILKAKVNSNLYDWLLSGKCVVVEGFICINSTEYVIKSDKGIYVFTTIALNNLELCCVPNSPVSVINPPTRPGDLPEEHVAAYLFEDIFQDKQIDEDKLKQQARLLEKMPNTFSDALTYIMDSLNYKPMHLSDDSYLDMSVISNLRNHKERKPNLRSILLICATMRLTPVISLRLTELAGYHLRPTNPKELCALYILFNSGNIITDEVLELCDQNKIS